MWPKVERIESSFPENRNNRVPKTENLHVKIARAQPCQNVKLSQKRLTEIVEEVGRKTINCKCNNITSKSCLAVSHRHSESQILEGYLSYSVFKPSFLLQLTWPFSESNKSLD